MTEARLTDEQFVRLVIQEIGDRPNSSLAQLVYLLQRSGAPSRYRFDYARFLGMWNSAFEGSVEAERFRLLLGKNGLPEEEGSELRAELRELVARLPSDDHDLRLVAVADFLRRNGCDSRAGVPLEMMLERVKPELAPGGMMSGREVLDCLERLELATQSGDRAA